MSRSGYSEDYTNDWELIRWRGAMASAIKGKRGQAFLKEMLVALDAMPDKKLVANSLVDGDQVCAIGAVGLRRGIDMSKLDTDRQAVAKAFGIAAALAAEIAYMNDEYSYIEETPQQRWGSMRAWVVDQIRNESVN